MDLSELSRITVVKANGGWVIQGPIFVPPKDVGEEDFDGDCELIETFVRTTREDALELLGGLMLGVESLPEASHADIAKGMKYYKPPKGDDDTPVKA